MTSNLYDTYKYGNTHKYGPSTAEDALIWSIEVDWDGDGIFDGTNEAGRLIGIPTVTRGRMSMLRPNGQGYENISSGKCTFYLSNHDDRYNGWNTSSPLYPNVDCGKDVRIKVRDMNTGTTYNIFYGVIDDIQPVYDLNGDMKAFFTISDGWNYLRNNNANYAIQENITPGQAIGFTLDNIDWPTRWGRNIDAGSDTIRYWFADGDQSAGSSLNDIAISFLGYFFIAADGKARYIHRSNVTTSVVDYSQAELLKDITVPQPWINLRNVTRIKSHPLNLAASGIIYQLLGSTPSILPGAVNALEMFGTYTYNNVPVSAKDVIAPVATTDYTMNTNADGSGVDKTADCTVTITDFGKTVLFNIVNNSSGLVYVTKLNVRGKALYQSNASDVQYPSASPTEPRRLVLDLPWQQDINVAIDFVRLIGGFLSTRHPFPIIQIENRPELQFTPDLFDLVTLTSSKYGIYGDSFRVAYISHRGVVSDNSHAVRTILYLEPYITTDSFWTWDTASDFDDTTVFGV